MSLEKALGGAVVRRVMDGRTNLIGAARGAGKLFVGATGGLSLSGGAKAAPVPRNTYFGD